MRSHLAAALIAASIHSVAIARAEDAPAHTDKKDDKKPDKKDDKKDDKKKDDKKKDK